MLDIKFIRENKKQVEEAAKNKHIKVDIDKLLKLDEEKREVQTKIEELRAQRNELASSTKGGKPTAEQISKGKSLKEEISKIEEKGDKIEGYYNNLMYQVPNVTSDDTPVGKGEDENKILRTVGKPKKFDFEPKDHMELGIMHNIIDTERATQTSGSRFNYLFGEAVMLQFALVQFVFETLTDAKIIKKIAKETNNPFDKPFIPVVPPVIVKADVMKKMDRFDPIDDRYYLEQDDSLLVGSAEHSLGPIHMDEVIDEKDLPIRYVGYSTAFRREAGTYGKDTNGILRRHQFDKLEMETFVSQEQGEVGQDFIIRIQEYLVQALEIPYQVVLKCTGDIGGKADFRAIDIECHMPGQGKYRETHTSDYMTDFQARRLNIKYKNKAGEKQLVYMNDATAFAIGRALIAILENYQKEDGSIEIPKVLQKYMPSGIKIISKK